MTDLRFPLHWPEGWRRTDPHKRKRAPYKVTEERARTEMLQELKRLGAHQVQLSTNLELKRDGLPYATQKRLQEDPGVAVYFMLDGRSQTMACDQWDRVGDNYRAIGLAVAALRQLQRCGASEVLERAFRGFAALPPAAVRVDCQALALARSIEGGEPHGARRWDAAVRRSEKAQLRSAPGGDGAQEVPACAG